MVVGGFGFMAVSGRSSPEPRGALPVFFMYVETCASLCRAQHVDAGGGPTESPWGVVAMKGRR
jgi:hypothetical protein